MHRRIFLRSEGNVLSVGVARSREIVSRFNRFYSDVARAYGERPGLRADHLINSLLEPLLEIDGDNPITTPLSRLDAVLEDDGSIRAIEINSVGVPRAHARPVLPDPRAIARRVAEDAATLDQLARDMVVHGFLAYARAATAPRAAGVRRGDAVGLVSRGSSFVSRRVERAGCDYV